MSDVFKCPHCGLKVWEGDRVLHLVMYHHYVMPGTWSKERPRPNVR